MSLTSRQRSALATNILRQRARHSKSVLLSIESLSGKAESGAVASPTITPMRSAISARCRVIARGAFLAWSPCPPSPSCLYSDLYSHVPTPIKLLKANIRHRSGLPAFLLCSLCSLSLGISLSVPSQRFVYLLQPQYYTGERILAFCTLLTPFHTSSLRTCAHNLKCSTEHIL